MFEVISIVYDNAEVYVDIASLIQQGLSYRIAVLFAEGINNTPNCVPRDIKIQILFLLHKFIKMGETSQFNVNFHCFYLFRAVFV
ncbi:MAG TPA: hypothetical protein DCR97_06075 [Deltaproteobacteria bacterium]|nr:hypothetical protein [Deltaproteobacteria bacterium]